ncbi:MAG: hypothetical protein QOD50_2127 [Actinomycetota bacterium]|nr:hypothetical protein [Actinomycetota bacterium]
MRIRLQGPAKGAIPALSAVALATGLALVPAAAASATNMSGAAALVDVTQTNLVSDHALTSDPNVVVDPTLVNPWGMSFGTGATPTPLWVSDNGQEASTLYRTSATPPAFAKVPLTVAVPGGPTGQVFNPSASEFAVTVGQATGPAKFIFATESGWIYGWNPNVPAANSTTATPAGRAPNGVLKGLALASANGSDFLYAADFSNGAVDVFDTSFALQNWKGAFRDPMIPKSYAPFNVQLLNGKLYVTYAKKKAGTVDDEAGLGHGFVDVYTTTGRLDKRLVRHRALNSPWGLAIAPSSWGPLAGSLLVGNFGDGQIHAYNAKNGRSLGTIGDAAHNPITIDGLWGLMPGNGVAGDPQSVIFTAGPGEETQGLLGILTAVPEA